VKHHLDVVGLEKVFGPGESTESADSRSMPASGSIARLATFPEQNPNPVIETDEAGRVVTYMNPAAVARFPDLASAGPRHPLLEGLDGIATHLRAMGSEFVEREVMLGDEIYEQRVCYTPLAEGGVVRVYAHDVTARRRGEKALQELARRVVLAQEEERRRVSRELHDEAGQALAMLKLSLQLLTADPEATATMRRSLADTVALVESTRDQIRQLAQRLRPPSLDALDLNSALAEVCAEFERRTGLDVRYRSPSGAINEPMDAVKVCLYRFLQEALTNAGLHAEARSVEVALEESSDSVALQVQDDGRGMDPAAAWDGRRVGLGLKGMRERIELLEGTFEIDSRPGQGTRLTVVLPRLEG
jgi:signal transduction histidine kinase